MLDGDGDEPRQVGQTVVPRSRRWVAAVPLTGRSGVLVQATPFGYDILHPVAMTDANAPATGAGLLSWVVDGPSVLDLRRAVERAAGLGELASADGPRPYCGVQELAASPDGALLALACVSRVPDLGLVHAGILVIVSGAEPSARVVPVPSPESLALNPHWLGASGRLAYDVVDRVCLACRTYIWDAATDAVEAVRLTMPAETALPPIESDDTTVLAVSADGQHLAIGAAAATVAAGAPTRLAVCTASGGVEAVLADAGVWDAAWSPDGRYLAYISTGGFPDLWHTEPLLTSDLSAYLAVWSLEEHRVVFRHEVQRPIDPRDDPLIPYELAW